MNSRPSAIRIIASVLILVLLAPTLASRADPEGKPSRPEAPPLHPGAELGKPQIAPNGVVLVASLKNNAQKILDVHPASIVLEEKVGDAWSGEIHDTPGTSNAPWIRVEPGKSRNVVFDFRQFIRAKTTGIFRMKIHVRNMKTDVRTLIVSPEFEVTAPPTSKRP